MYQLEETYYFYFLAVIPLVVFLFLSVMYWKNRTQKNFADREALNKLSPYRSVIKPTIKIIILSFAFFLLVTALVNPKIGTSTQDVKREGVDLVFAIDVSKSMDAEDIAPNRLEKSKQLVSQILNTLGGDRVGIVGYAGSAFPQLPITTDFNAARMFLNSMNTDMVSSQGTAISDAIKMSQGFYQEEDQTNKVLIILSDGEDHEGNAVEVAKSAADQGIRIFTIGVGTPSGGPIPIKRNGIIQSYKRDMNQERVITRLEQSTLEEIAQNGNGNYIDGSNTAYVVEQIKESLSTIDKTEFESRQYADFKDQFQWFAGLAFLLLFIDIFLLERKTYWLQKLNLFNERKNE